MNAILLAAGQSKRMGVQKLLLPFGKSTVIETVIENLARAGFSPILAVFSREVEAGIPNRSDRLLVGINEFPERGQSSSLAIGLDMLPDGEDFCIMLGDLPFVGPDEMRALRDHFLAMPENKTVFTPCRDGIFGHPMFYRSLWKERFSTAKGDAGGRNILKKYSGEILTANTKGCHFKDLDTPDDYKKFVGKC